MISKEDREYINDETNNIIINLKELQKEDFNVKDCMEKEIKHFSKIFDDDKPFLKEFLKQLNNKYAENFLQLNLF